MTQIALDPFVLGVFGIIIEGILDPIRTNAEAIFVVVVIVVGVLTSILTTLTEVGKISRLLRRCLAF